MAPGCRSQDWADHCREKTDGKVVNTGYDDVTVVLVDDLSGSVDSSCEIAVEDREIEAGRDY
jgi:hypothetical protein